ncbi:hypothetical protein D9M71_769530 [compost metagenome]
MRLNLRQAIRQACQSWRVKHPDQNDEFEFIGERDDPKMHRCSAGDTNDRNHPDQQRDGGKYLHQLHQDLVQPGTGAISSEQPDGHP